MTAPTSAFRLVPEPVSPDWHRTPLQARDIGKPSAQAEGGEASACPNSIGATPLPKSSSRKRGAVGSPAPGDAHQVSASGRKKSTGHLSCENQAKPASGNSGDGVGDHADLIAEIVQSWRQRVRWLKAKNALVLQAKAFCRAMRDGDKAAGTKMFDDAKAGNAPLDGIALEPFLQSIEIFEGRLSAQNKHLEKLVRQLPIHAWMKTVKGFGGVSLAAMIGDATTIDPETGAILDIGTYKSVSALWKRMGLAVIDGGRQRKVADAELALIHGYSPSRRSTAWNLARSIIKAQIRADKTGDGEKIKGSNHALGPYGEFYIAEKARQMAICEVIAADPDLVKKYTRTAKKYSAKAHANNRAMRHMAKRLLRDLYLEWRRVSLRHEEHATQLVSARGDTNHA